MFWPIVIGLFILVVLINVGPILVGIVLWIVSGGRNSVKSYLDKRERARHPKEKDDGSFKVIGLDIANRKEEDRDIIK